MIDESVLGWQARRKKLFDASRSDGLLFRLFFEKPKLLKGFRPPTPLRQAQDALRNRIVWLVVHTHEYTFKPPRTGQFG